MGQFLACPFCSWAEQSPASLDKQQPIMPYSLYQKEYNIIYPKAKAACTDTSETSRISIPGASSAVPGITKLKQASQRQ